MNKKIDWQGVQLILCCIISIVLMGLIENPMYY